MYNIANIKLKINNYLEDEFWKSLGALDLKFFKADCEVELVKTEVRFHGAECYRLNKSSNIISRIGKDVMIVNERWEKATILPVENDYSIHCFFRNVLCPRSPTPHASNSQLAH